VRRENKRRPVRRENKHHPYAPSKGDEHVSRKIKDPDVAAGIAAFNSWRTEREVPTGVAWRAIPKKQRSKIWREYQRERWGFDCYYGDNCGLETTNPGHVEDLLKALRSGERVAAP
jgi:hypothetical protein